MKAYILIFLVSIFNCVNIKETSKEDVTLSGGLAASQARLLALTSKTHSIEIQLTRLSNEKLMLAREQNSIYKNLTNMNLSKSHELAQLYKKLTLSQIENKKSEINNLIEQKKNVFKKLIDERNRRKEEISEKEKELDIKINQLNTELEATKTMLEQIKVIINKDIEKGFKLFKS